MGVVANMHPTPDEKICWWEQLERLGEHEVKRLLDVAHNKHRNEEFVLPGDCGSHPWRGFVAAWYQAERDSKAGAEDRRWWVGTIVAVLGVVIVYLGVASALDWWPFQ